MRVAVTGASGMIGRALVTRLEADGHEVLRLVRRTPRTAAEHRWDPQHRRIDPALLRDVDAVVHLAGEPIRPRPWTKAYKQRLLDSRIDGTVTISDGLAAAVAQDPDLGEVIAVRSMVYLALTYDHRLVDGADAARFLAAVKHRLEEADFEAELGVT